jgi:hypothetical protein
MLSAATPGAPVMILLLAITAVASPPPLGPPLFEGGKGGIASPELPNSGRQIRLRYQFTPGAKAAYQTEQRQTTTIKAEETSTTVNVRMTVNLTLAVESVEPATGAARLRIKADRIRINVDGDYLFKREIDTNTASINDASLEGAWGLLKALTAGESIVTCTPLGEVKEVKLPEPFLARLREPIGEVSIFGSFSQFREDQAKSLVTGPLIPLPQDAVAAGSRWGNPREVKFPIADASWSGQYTYAGKARHDGRELEKIEQTLQTRVQSKPDQLVEMKLQTKAGAATILFDNVQGRIHDIQSRLVVEMEVNKIGLVAVENTITTKLQGP